MLTSHAISAFLAAKEAKGLSVRTLTHYRYRLGVFERMYPELPMQATQLDTFLGRVGPSQESRETYYRLLRNLYRFLARRPRPDDGPTAFIKRRILGRTYIRANPIEDVEAPILKPRVARSLTAAQLHLLLTHPGHSPAARAFLYLLADTGLRLSEAMSVDHADKVGLDTIVVVGKVGEREVPISPRVAGMVAEQLPWPWTSNRSLWDVIRKAFERAGLGGKRASAHTLRHTFVRLWEGDESLLVGILGWTSARMLRVYKPYNINRAIEQHREFSPIVAAEKETLAQPRLL